MNKFLSVLILSLGLFSRAQTEPNCDNARTFFDGILQPSVLNDQPTSTGGACSSATSCCSPLAVSQLKAKAKTDFKSAMKKRIESVTATCSQDAYRKNVLHFLSEQKVFFEEQVQRFFDSYYSNQTRGLFDGMFDVAGEYMLKERELCGLQTLITDTAFQVFKKILKATYSNVPDTTEFDQCSKGVYLFMHNRTLQNERFHMENSLIRIAHVVQFSQLLSNYTETVETEGLSEKCADLLTKYQYCDGCSGAYSDRSTKALCSSECQAAINICLHPYNVIKEVADNWRDNAEEIKSTIGNFDPSRMFSSVPLTVLRTVMGILRPPSFLVIQINSRCRTSLTARNVIGKRSVRHVNRRQASLNFLQASLSEVDCITKRINSVYFPTTVTEMCSNSTSTACSGPTNSVQPNLVTPTQGIVADDLKLQSRFILGTIFACHDRDECPDIRDFCWVNNLDLEKTPTAKPVPPVVSSTVRILPSTSITTSSVLESSLVSSSSASVSSATSSSFITLSSSVSSDVASSSETSSITPSITSSITSSVTLSIISSSTSVQDSPTISTFSSVSGTTTDRPLPPSSTNVPKQTATSPKPSVFPTTGSIDLDPIPWTDVHVDWLSWGTDSTTQGPTGKASLSQVSAILITVLFAAQVAFYYIQ